MTTEKGVIKDIRVLKGAPCGATWHAAEEMKGLPIEDALTRFGLEVQFVCQHDFSDVGGICRHPTITGHIEF